MKKIITFGQHSAILERSKSAALLEVKPAPAQLSELADAINEADYLDVTAIFPGRGKIAFVVENSTANAAIICAVCDAIAGVFDTDTVVSNERAEEIV